MSIKAPQQAANQSRVRRLIYFELSSDEQSKTCVTSGGVVVALVLQIAGVGRGKNWAEAVLPRHKKKPEKPSDQVDEQLTRRRTGPTITYCSPSDKAKFAADNGQRAYLRPKRGARRVR